MKAGAAAAVRRALSDLSGYSLRTQCPEPRLNGIMNFWAEKQVRFCSLGKKAVRDNAQLAMAIDLSDKSKNPVNFRSFLGFSFYKLFKKRQQQLSLLKGKPRYCASQSPIDTV